MNINLDAAIRSTPLRILETKVQQAAQVVPPELVQAAKHDTSVNLLAFNTLVEVQQSENRLVDTQDATKDQTEVIQSAIAQVTQAYKVLDSVRVPQVDITA